MFYDAEDFQGESWTIQCEIIHNDLLGGIPPDEEPVPELPLQPNAPFDFFGHGQVGHGPVDDNCQDNLAFAPQNQDMAPQNEDMADWEPWPEVQLNLANNMVLPVPNPDINLNELPADVDMYLNGGEVLNPDEGGNSW